MSLILFNKLTEVSFLIWSPSTPLSARMKHDPDVADLSERLEELLHPLIGRVKRQVADEDVVVLHATIDARPFLN